MDAWLQEIERAMTEGEVVAAARDYCSLLHPRELLALPKDCREIHIDTEADIPRVRRKLSAGFAAVDDPDADVERVRVLVDYMSRAEKRLGELRGMH